MTIIHSTIPESQLQETVELVEFHIPEEFKREESDRLLDLFRPRNHYLPPDWFLRKNNVGQNILYWSIQFNQTQLTAAVLWHFSYLKRYEEKGFLSFLKDHENGDKNILALAFDTSGSNPNTARLTIISELLSYKDIVEQLLDHENRLEDERHQGSLHIAAVHGVLSVFQKLQEWYGEKLDEWLQNYQREEKDSLTPLDIAIEKGNVEIVKILITSYQRPEPTLDERTNLELLPGTSILHKALNVLTPNQDIVNLIMQYYPELLWQYNKESKTPLMELRHMINTRRQSRKFRADQVPTGEAEEMLTYLETKLFRSDWPISKINRSLGLELEGSAETFWDLTFLNYMPASIWNFIDQLTSNGATFFQRLKSVKLPDLQCHDESFKMCRGRSEDGDDVTEIDVLSIFEFLREKGVKHIEYLEVPDCLIHPHSDSQIEKCLSGFDIFSLNWRKRDMSYRMLSRAVPGLSELTFYTSGNEDILDYWASKLMQCKLQEFHIRILNPEGMKFLQTQDPTYVGVDYLMQKAEEYFYRFPNKMIGHQSSPMEIRNEIISQGQGRENDISIEQEIKLPLYDIDTYKPWNYASMALETERTGLISHIGRIFTKMADTGIYECLKQWRSDSNWQPIKNLESEPIKVAILDSGISHYHLPVARYGVTGRSFVEDFEGSQNDKHWHSPMIGHGTRVAHLILGMTKDVHLIIAKIQSGPQIGEINVSAATKALYWVAKEGADIICMSWGIGEDALTRQETQPGSIQGAFRDAIMFASRKALLFGALSNDPDLQNGRFVPANFPSCYKISSYFLSTERKIESEHNTDAIYFPAEGLELTQVPDYFTDSTIKIAGTSYATALAAGTAALLLVCVKLAYDNQNKAQLQAKLREFKRPEGKMRSIFTQDMRLSTNREHENLVAPWEFFRGARWDTQGATSSQKQDRLKHVFDSIR